MNNPPQICCYKCGNLRSLLVEEKLDKKTGKVIEKNFICVHCADKSFCPDMEKTK